MKIQVDLYPREQKTVVFLITDTTSNVLLGAGDWDAYKLAKDLGLESYQTTTFGDGRPTHAVCLVR